MPTLSIPDPTFNRLSERAAALNMSVEELVTPAGPFFGPGACDRSCCQLKGDS